MFIKFIGLSWVVNKDQFCKQGRSVAAHWAHDPKVVGSNPTPAIIIYIYKWVINSMVEYLFYTQKVSGSIPLSPIDYKV